MSDTMTVTVERIADALWERDLEAARTRFDEVMAGLDEESVTAFLKALAATVEIAPGTVMWGFGIDMFANPRRDGYAWRCGSCRKVGVNYRTGKGALDAATEHAGEHRPAFRVEAWGGEEYAAVALSA